MKIKIVYQSRKSIKLEVNDDTVVITAPYLTSKTIINQFVEKKQAWNNQQLKLQSTYFISDHQMVYFGQTINLIKGKQTKMLDNQTIVYKSRQSLIDFLVQQLNQKIEQYCQQFQLILPFHYQSINIRNLKRSWGNCRSDKKLTFAFRLVHTPPIFIQAVVAHEISHLFEMNHSQRFYRVVEQFCPNYRKIIKQYYSLNNDLSGSM